MGYDTYGSGPHTKNNTLRSCRGDDVLDERGGSEKYENGLNQETMEFMGVKVRPKTPSSSNAAAISCFVIRPIAKRLNETSLYIFDDGCGLSTKTLRVKALG